METLQAAINERPEGHFPKADIALIGEAEKAALAGADFKTIFEALADTYRDGRRRDAAAGRTLSGPHRTDLAVVHRPTGAPAHEASTGQQKALLVGLILASASALKTEDGAAPILLFDEAAAHLDPDRRAALYDELCALGGQAWLTGTESYLFEAFKDRAQLFQINEGDLTPG